MLDFVCTIFGEIFGLILGSSGCLELNQVRLCLRFIFMRCNKVVSKVNSGRETFNRHEEIIMKNSLLSLCNMETESK